MKTVLELGEDYYGLSVAAAGKRDLELLSRDLVYGRSWLVDKPHCRSIDSQQGV